MKKARKKCDHCPAKHSDAVGLQALQVEETTKRQQILHGTLQVLVSAITQILLALLH